PTIATLPLIAVRNPNSSSALLSGPTTRSRNLNEYGPANTVETPHRRTTPVASNHLSRWPHLSTLDMALLLEKWAARPAPPLTWRRMRTRPPGTALQVCLANGRLRLVPVCLSPPCG